MCVKKITILASNCVTLSCNFTLPNLNFSLNCLPRLFAVPQTHMNIIISYNPKLFLY